MATVTVKTKPKKKRVRKPKTTRSDYNLKQQVKYQTQLEVQKLMKNMPIDKRIIQNKRNNTYGVRNSEGALLRGRRNSYKNIRARFGTEVSIKPMTAAYLDMVSNPFSVEQISRKPDNIVNPSVVLKDYVQSSQLSLHVAADNLPDTLLYGVFIFFQYGYTIMQENSLEPNTDPYNIWIVGENSDGLLCSANTGNDIGQVLDFANKGQVANLASGIRPLALGMRALPTIEMITDSSTDAVEYFWGGFATVEQIYTNFWTDQTQQPVMSMIQNTQSPKQFANKDGCSVRLSPCNPTLDEYATLQALKTESVDYSGVPVPFIFAHFNHGLTGTLDTDTNERTFTIPVYFDSMLYLETQLQFPTCLFPTRSPCDPDWVKICMMINAATNSGVLPLVTEGHSFKTIIQNMPKLTNFARRFFNFGSEIIDPINAVSNAFTSNFYKRKARRELRM